MARDYPRSRRIGHQLQQELAGLLPEVRDLRLLVQVMPTITGVDVSPDMRSARVFFSLLEGSGRATEVQALLQRASGFLRGQLGRMLDVRRIPKLVFAYDRTLDEAARISALLHGTAR